MTDDKKNTTGDIVKSESGMHKMLSTTQASTDSWAEFAKKQAGEKGLVPSSNYLAH